MSEKNLKTSGSKELLSEESEDYTLDDIIQLHKVDDESDDQGYGRKALTTKSTPSTSPVNKGTKAFSKTPDYNLNLENNDYNLKDIKDVDAVVKRVSSILSTRVSSNINRFSNMTYCEEVLQVLYQALENISKNRGNAKEIIDIGTRIETVEAEKLKQFINQEEINKTIDDIVAIISTLSRIQDILENRVKT
jgi:hypothetical protein